MSSTLFDHHSPLAVTASSGVPRPFARNSFLSSSQENVNSNAVIDGARPQSRPNSRRSSRIFTANLNLPAREDSPAYNPWTDSPVGYDSPPLMGLKARTPKAKESIGNSWGVSSIGRGFDWTWNTEPEPSVVVEPIEESQPDLDDVGPLPSSSTIKPAKWQSVGRSLSLDLVPTIAQNSSKMTLSLSDGILVPQAQSQSHTRPTTPSSLASVPPSPRYRRRSSQKRFSLISGRLTYTPPPSPPPESTMASKVPKLLRLASTSSFMSVNSTIANPPTPGKVHYAGERSIAEFVIQGDVGQGAYGLVKRGREVMPDGSYGVCSLFRSCSYFSIAQR